MQKRLVIGNWKMNGSLDSNNELLTSLRTSATYEAAINKSSIAVCPPFPYLAQAAQALKGTKIAIGAQNLSQHENGAYTGDVSAAMLANIGCTMVIVGHSERRAIHLETDQLVAHKAQAALNAGLVPVVCVGETLEQQQAGHTLGVIATQLAPVLALGQANVTKIVIAYEPVWAIGTGLTATPQQAQEVHGAIRASLNSIGAGSVRILYGGSVNASNAASLFAMPDINGALVGGASLKAQEFLNIAAA